MQHTIRRALCAVLLLCLIVGNLGASAAIPKPMFGLLETYQKAKASGDNAALKKAILACLDFVKDKDYEEKNLNIAHMYKELGQLYEAEEQYALAAEAYATHATYFDVMDWEPSDRRYSEYKALTLEPTLSLYVETPGTYDPYDAPFANKSGVMFGAPYDSDPRITSNGIYTYEDARKVFPVKPSAALIYCEFPKEDITTQPRYENYLKIAKEHGETVVFAWNAYTDIKDVTQYADYIDRTLRFLGDSGANIIIRWSAEMDVDPNITDGAGYIKAYRYIADKIKKYPNLANVWSPNALSSVDKTLDMFYPGDDYVDWIGLSLYMSRVFTHNESDTNNVTFLTAEYANPIINVQPILLWMKDRGIDKPLMVSEAGASHRNLQNGDSYEAWALYQLRMLYTALPRMYPQIRLINYFNALPDKTRKLDYALFTSEALTKAYNEVTAQRPMLGSGESSTGVWYHKIPYDYSTTSRNLTVSAVAYYPKSYNVQLKYFLDGKELKLMSAPPYEVKLTGLSVGEHKLRIEMYDGDEPRLDALYTITVKE